MSGDENEVIASVGATPTYIGVLEGGCDGEGEGRGRDDGMGEGRGREGMGGLRGGGMEGEGRVKDGEMGVNDRVG